MARSPRAAARSVKNVSGYDMSRLHIGGLGTLGTMLEASFKLTPLPMYEKTVLATFNSHQTAMDTAMRVFNSQVMPLALTGFDDATAIRSRFEVGGPGPRIAVRLGGRPRTLDRQVNEVVGVCRDAGADRPRRARRIERRGSVALARGLWLDFPTLSRPSRSG